MRAEDIERGIYTERFNMRGVYTKSLYEGGAQERALAERYRLWARASKDYAAMSALLERIAEGWERDAESEDTRAKLDKMRD